MADFAISAAVIDQLLDDLLTSLNDCDQIGIDCDLLDCLVKDRFEEPERNQAAREFLIAAYKELLSQKIGYLEEDLKTIRKQFEELRRTQVKGKTQKRQPLVESSSYLSGFSTGD